MRDIEKFGTELEVALVSIFVRDELFREPRLFRPPLRRFLVEEALIDPTVKLVVVHGLDPVLQLRTSGLEARNGLPMVPLLVPVTDAQRALHQLHGVVAAQTEAAQEIGELLVQDLFADVGLRTSPSAARAAVVNVAALPYVTRQRAPAMPAPDQARVGEVPLRLPWLLSSPLVEQPLDPLPCLPRDEGSMDAGVDRAGPLEFSQIGWVPEHVVDRAPRYKRLGPAEPEALLPGHPADLLKRGVAFGVHLKHLADDQGGLGIDFDGPLPVRPGHIPSPQGRVVGHHAPLGLLWWSYSALRAVLFADARRPPTWGS